MYTPHPQHPSPFFASVFGASVPSDIDRLLLEWAHVQLLSGLATDVPFSLRESLQMPCARIRLSNCAGGLHVDFDPTGRGATHCLIMSGKACVGHVRSVARKVDSSVVLFHRPHIISADVRCR